ncbi:hypothetical protein [Nocardia sp. NPDC047648]|uniref:hypothetical protein n=1 Tax=Nocardia sp. NPDC047648 TaxID=3155625 RepID=UPI0034008247
MTAQVTFQVPTNWKTIVGGDLAELTCTADTLGDALRWFAKQYPTLANRILTDTGQIPRYATIALDGERISSSDRLDLPLPGTNHEVALLSAFMGG